MTDIRRKVENWFENWAETFFRHRFKTIIIMLIFAVAMIVHLPKITLDVSTEGFLCETDQALIDYNGFRDQFGRDELVLVAIRGSDIFSPSFLKKLKQLHEELADQVPHLDDITSLINARNTRGEGDSLIVQDLLDPWPETPQAFLIAKKRALENPLYKNLLISKDARFTTIVIKTQTYSSAESDTDVLSGFDEKIEDTPAPKARLYLTDRENSEVVAAVRTISQKYNASDFEIDIAGSAAVTHFLKQALMKDMRQFLALAFLTVAILLYIMFRRISGVLLPLLVVILSLLSTVGLMALGGIAIKLPTQILPSFLLAVSVGYSVHILALFFHHFKKHNDKQKAVIYAVGHSGLAVLMTAATTAGGLFSFSTSEIAPIADLGLAAGVGVLLALIYTIVLLPALISLTPLRKPSQKKEASQKTLTDRVMEAVTKITVSYPYPILLISSVLLIFSIVGISKIRFVHDPLRWFPPDNEIRVATEKIDKNLRGSINLEIIVDSGVENGLYEPVLLKKLDKTAKFLEALEVDTIFVGKAWSLTTILKETNQALNENRAAFYTIPDNRDLAAQELLLFENSGSDDLEDFVDSQFRLARLSAKVPFEDAMAYNNFLVAVEAHLNAEYNAYKITTTGMFALLTRTLHAAVSSMLRSYGYALVIISVLMIILIGRLRIGLLSMIPNLTPILMTLGIMGWFNIPMNLFTMLVGNIAIGLAVDDTIHFMHNFRRYYDQSGDAATAIGETLHSTGRAMLVTSIVLSIGFFIFMFAQMDNLYYFGLLTGCTIILALLADYFLAPALMMVVHRKKGEIEAE
jgi:uncharacterized protein